MDFNVLGMLAAAQFLRIPEKWLVLGQSTVKRGRLVA